MGGKENAWQTGESVSTPTPTSPPDVTRGGYGGTPLQGRGSVIGEMMTGSVAMSSRVAEQLC